MAGLVVPIVLLGLVVVLAYGGQRWIRAKERQAGDRWLQEAGRVVAADAGGRCTLASTVGPILGWYSGCEPITFLDPANARAPAEAGESVYVVFTTIDERVGRPHVLASYRSELDLVEIATIGQDPRVVTVFRVQP